VQKPEIENYDFRKPKLLSKEIMRALHKIHNLFSRDLERIFTNVLNLKVEAVLEEIEQVISMDFLGRIKSPSALFLFDIEELDDWAVLQIDPSFCIFLVEHESGGRSMKLGEARALTHLEERIIGRTIDKIFNVLTHIWSSYIHINMTISNYVYESKTANIRIISSQLPGIEVGFKLKVEGLEVPFRICYPYALLKQQMKKSFSEFSSKDIKESLSDHQYQQFENEMKQVDILTKVRLGTTKLPIQQLLNLDKGDLIKLDQHIDKPLNVFVNNKVKMMGYPGLKGGMKAIKVFEILENNN